MRFSELELNEQLIEGIEAIGFENATPVQALTIPPIMAGKDIIASAQTGTGKTAAFLLPMINRIMQSGTKDHIRAMVIVPTRELAIQIEQQMDGFSYFTPVSSIAVYGGGDGALFAREKQALTSGINVIICTPGRMTTHLNMGYVNLKYVDFLVLDEADRMLDMGFFDDIMKMISFLPEKRQNLMFSATMPPKIRQLAMKILHNPEQINIAISRPPDRIKQSAFIVFDRQKLQIVKHLLTSRKTETILIFCSTKHNVKQLTFELKRMHLNAAEIHSDMEQDAREKTLHSFKNKRTNILVATDILARGIDVEDIDLVINYDVPDDCEDYVHRIGRTARAETKGEAITIAGEKEHHRLNKIEQFLEIILEKGIIPTELGEGPSYNPQQKAEKKFRPSGGKSQGGRPSGGRSSGGRPSGGGNEKRR